MAHLWYDHGPQLAKHGRVNKENETASAHFSLRSFCMSIQLQKRNMWKQLSLLGPVYISLSFIIEFCLAHSEHNFDGRAHSNHEDHIAFLGEELAKEFEKLSPQEARRRLR